MNRRFGMSRGTALAVAALAAIVASTLPGSASASAETGGTGGSDHWGVIARNTIGSPVAALRKGPFGTYGVQGPLAAPPYGAGSLGIEVADHATSLADPAEKIDFGNEVDFYNKPVLDLNKLGFHVFQTGENVDYGGTKNLPNIRLEIDANLNDPTTDDYTTLVWVPDALPVTNQWSGYIDATASGYWFLTGAEGTATGCTASAPTPCTFAQVKAALDDGGDAPKILTVAVGKGRDHLWAGAVDGLRINDTIYDFEANGVRALRAN
ncbi:hypothetical protein ACFWVU_35465 [Streptomyces sp. NPDC058686]|uniref:hypothetical protein n=1 Tax=Streptomyces sp. NPDC058686 TaxID=3346599 RepID=UPI003668BA62